MSGHSRNTKSPEYPHRRHQSPNLRNRTANFDEDDSSGDEPTEGDKERAKEVFEIDLGFGKKNEIFIMIKGLLPKEGNTKMLLLNKLTGEEKLGLKDWK